VPALQRPLAKLKALDAKAKKSSGKIEGAGMTAVQSWLSTSTSLNGNDDEGVHGSTSEWRKLEWAEAIQFAQDKLLMSRTNDRIEFVKHELLNLVKHEGASQVTTYAL